MNVRSRMMRPWATAIALVWIMAPALLAAQTAESPALASLIARVRAARIRHDSAVRAYDAAVLSRFSMGLGFRQTGRERLFGRVDHAYRVKWRRGVGARVTMTGAREGMPALDGMPLNLEVTTFLPFIPGTDMLWAGGVLATADLPPDALVHPFSANADTSYRFAVGDGVTFSMGPGRDIRVRELRITPRRTDWRLVVGSFWVDEANGQLVRAAYRLAAPMTARAVLGDSAYREIFADLPRWLVPFFEPVRASLDLLEVEYGLYEGIWLPRRQSATWFAQLSAFRMPLLHEERYSYDQLDVGETVGGVASIADDRDTLPALPAPAWMGVRLGGSGTAYDTERPVDVAWRALDRTSGDSLRARLERATTPADSTRLRHRLSCLETGRAFDRAVLPGVSERIVLEVPCDYDALARSPTLPATLFSPMDSLLSREAWRRELRARVGLSQQPRVASRRGAVTFSLAEGALRYNRVEGLSGGLAYVQPIGRGWTARQELRYGIGNARWQGGTTWSRASGRHALIARVHDGTAAVTDYGQPLSFGASTATLAQGHDDGVYVRASGLDLTWQTEPRGATRGRLFVERQAPMPVVTQWTLEGGSGDRRLGPNVEARPGTWSGVTAGDRRTFGLDPAAWRVFTDVRLEAATGTSTYGRWLGEGTVVSPTWRRLNVASTWAHGGSVGAPPPQRHFFLGGSQTVRGHFVSPGSLGFSGAVFWFGRHELAYGRPSARVALFYDVGWAGSQLRPIGGRHALLRGGGIGATLLDGLIRMDWARGLAPVERTRIDVSMDVRF
jgi:hypothetical protein